MTTQLLVGKHHGGHVAEKLSLKWARLKAVRGNMERRKSSIDAAVRIPYESFDFAPDHLLLTRNDSEIGHVKEEAMRTVRRRRLRLSRRQLMLAHISLALLRVLGVPIFQA